MKVKHIFNARDLIQRTPSTTSVDSQSSTVPANGCDSKLTKPKGTKKLVKKESKAKSNSKGKVDKKLSVRFNEDQNEYYDNLVSAEERQKLWYTMDDVNQFRTLTVQLVQLVHKKEEGKDKGWSAFMRKAYRGFCMAERVQDVEEVIAAYSQTPVTASRAGLEKWAIRSMTADRMRRREELWNLLQKMQDAPYTSDDNKLNEIRLACRSLSRPGRLFAHHVARLSFRSASN